MAWRGRCPRPKRRALPPSVHKGRGARGGGTSTCTTTPTASAAAQVAVALRPWRQLARASMCVCATHRHTAAAAHAEAHRTVQVRGSRVARELLLSSGHESSGPVLAAMERLKQKKQVRAEMPHRGRNRFSQALTCLMATVSCFIGNCENAIISDSPNSDIDTVTHLRDINVLEDAFSCMVSMLPPTEKSTHKE